MRYKLTEKWKARVRERESEYTHLTKSTRNKKSKNEANPLWMVVNHIGFYVCVVDTTTKNMR